MLTTSRIRLACVRALSPRTWKTGTSGYKPLKKNAQDCGLLFSPRRSRLLQAALMKADNQIRRFIFVQVLGVCFAGAMSLCVSILAPATAFAQVGAAISGAADLYQMLARTAQAAGRPFRLLDEVPALRGRLDNVVERYGDEAVRVIDEEYARHGDDVLQAFAQSADDIDVFAVTTQLPVAQRGAAFRRMATRHSDDLLDDAIRRHGTAGLELELSHPGIGARWAAQASPDLVQVARQLNTDQLNAAVALRQSATDATLPRFEAIIQRHGANFVDFARRNRESFFVLGVGGVMLWRLPELIGAYESTLVAATSTAEVVVDELGETTRSTMGSGFGAVERVTTPLTEGVGTGIKWGVIIVAGAVALVGVWYLFQLANLHLATLRRRQD